MKALDLQAGWLDFGRPKTGIHRRCPLWPETVMAVRAALDKRPTPKKEITRTVCSSRSTAATWEPKSHMDNPVSKKMAKVLKALGIHRLGVGFYALGTHSRPSAGSPVTMTPCGPSWAMLKTRTT